MKEGQVSSLSVDTKRWLIRILIELTGKSITSIALEAGVDPTNLSRALKGHSTVSAQKMQKVLEYLGVDSVSGTLKPIVHRWTVPSHLIEDVLQVESIVQKILPGGGTIYPVRKKNPIMVKMTTESYAPWAPWIRWVLVPLAFPEVRVILKMGEKIKQLINPFDNHSPAPFRMDGWFWPDGSKGNEKEKIKKTLWVDLPGEMFLRASSDETLSILDLDAILRITHSWTWENLELRGWTPEKVAKKLGLENKEDDNVRNVSE